MAKESTSARPMIWFTIESTVCRWRGRHHTAADVTAPHPTSHGLTRHHCATPDHKVTIDHAPSCPGPPASAPRLSPGLDASTLPRR
eukprot:1738519-Prymnesium_polylepis.1